MFYGESLIKYTKRYQKLRMTLMSAVDGAVRGRGAAALRVLGQALEAKTVATAALHLIATEALDLR
jgi:hypothetical protein